MKIFGDGWSFQQKLTVLTNALQQTTTFLAGYVMLHARQLSLNSRIPGMSVSQVQRVFTKLSKFTGMISPVPKKSTISRPVNIFHSL